MNLHALAAGPIRMVNPNRNASIRVSTGYTTAADGTRVPTYAAPVGVSVQMQDVNAKEVAQLNGLNVQGHVASFYLNGDWQGVIRGDKRGGDLLDLDGNTWLIVQVSETWPDWCKFLACRQLD